MIVIRRSSVHVLLAVLAPIDWKAPSNAQASGPACTAPDSCSQIQYIASPDPIAGEWFGNSISVENDRMVIGAPHGQYDENAGPGTVYTYRLSDGQWGLEQIVRPLESEPYDGFGISVDLSGDILVVGAYGYAYLFDLIGNAWVQAERLRPDASANFGFDVDADGDRVAISATYKSCPNGDANCGAVWVFRKVGGLWLQEADLRSASPNAGDFFGHSIALNADRLVVGAPNDQDFCFFCGAVHVFRFDGVQWQLEQVLGDSVPVQNADFGLAVAIEGTTLIAAAPEDVVEGFTNCGSVSVFSFDGSQWQLSQEFLPNRPVSNARFGKKIAFKAGQLAITSKAGQESCQKLYSIHRFQLDGGQWMPTGTWKRTFITSEANDEFDAIENSASQVIVGESFTSCVVGGGRYCGRARAITFGVDQDDCDCNGTSDDCEPVGCLDDCNSNGQPDSCDIVGGSSSDCNDDDVPDECGLGSGDCNGNGEFDVCDLELGVSGECNFNEVPDECDIASGYSVDADANGIPDECPVDVPSPVIGLWHGTSRFISFSVPPAIPPQTEMTALRVDFIWMHWPAFPYFAEPTIRFTNLEGQSRWVGPPAEYTESSSNSQTFFAAQLQCTPHYRDWSSTSPLHVTGAEVVPSSRFDVVNVSHACIGHESTCGGVSASVDVRTTRWGDVTSPYAPPSAVVEPDIADISVIVNKFKNAPSAPTKPMVMLAGDEFGAMNPARDLDFSDISQAVDAFKGLAYPYKPGTCSVDGEPCLVDTDCCCGAVCTYCP